MVDGEATFAEVCDFLEELTDEGENKKAFADYAKIQTHVLMDLSALATGGSPPEASPAAEPPPPAPEDPSLDAFGNPLKCYKCDGEWHRQAVFPSREEVEVQCRGWGHYAAECHSKKAKGKGT